MQRERGFEGCLALFDDLRPGAEVSTQQTPSHLIQRELYCLIRSKLAFFCCLLLHLLHPTIESDDGCTKWPKNGIEMLGFDGPAANVIELQQGEQRGARAAENNRVQQKISHARAAVA